MCRTDTPQVTHTHRENPVHHRIIQPGVQEGILGEKNAVGSSRGRYPPMLISWHERAEQQNRTLLSASENLGGQGTCHPLCRPQAHKCDSLAPKAQSSRQSPRASLASWEARDGRQSVNFPGASAEPWANWETEMSYQELRQGHQVGTWENASKNGARMACQGHRRKTHCNLK